MKKVLLTASALSLLAGAAVAEVTVSGDARFGMKYDETTEDATLHQRYRVFFNASTETDGGLTFGAKMGLDSRTDDNTAGGINGTTVRQAHSLITISGMGFDFGMGNQSGAVVDTVGLWAGGLGFDGSLGRPAIVGGFDTDENANQTIKVGYSFGDFSVAASTIVGDSDTTEIAAKYSANGITVAAGADTDDNWAVSGSYASGDFVVGAIYRDGVAAQFRVWGNYSMGATKVGAVYTDVDGAEAYGIGVSHSLGGGVTAHAAVGQGTDGDMEAQLGFTMGF